MNLSGESIREVVNFYKISNEEIIVIYDDISLDVGRLRIREKGSHGGHNGIKSIIANLGTDVFPRNKCFKKDINSNRRGCKCNVKK